MRDDIENNNNNSEPEGFELLFLQVSDYINHKINIHEVILFAILFYNTVLCGSCLYFLIQLFFS